jgi:anti-sigma factor RsiW
MCPDTELLSAYFDGEIPEPWKGRMEAHIGACPDCKRALDGFSGLRRGFAADLSSAKLEESGARVLGRLDSELPRAARRRSREGWWTKSVRLPLPLAAAAVLAIAAVPALTVVASLGKPRGPSLAAATAAPASQVAQATVVDSSAYRSIDAMEVPTDIQDIDSLLRYLDSQQLPVTISVELPAGRRYGYAGPPEIIKAPSETQGGRGR